MLGWLVLGAVSFGLLMPKSSRERYRFVVTRSGFGGSYFECNPSTARFYKTALTAGALGAAVIIGTSILLGTVIGGLMAGLELTKVTSRFIGNMVVLLMYVDAAHGAGVHARAQPQ